MQRTKMFLSGKITGDEFYQEKFKKAEILASVELSCKNPIILNPATLPFGMTQEDYMRICFAMIDCSDIVCFINDPLSGESKGSLLEYEYCKYIDKPFYLMST